MVLPQISYVSMVRLDLGISQCEFGFDVLNDLGMDNISALFRTFVTDAYRRTYSNSLGMPFGHWSLPHGNHVPQTSNVTSMSLWSRHFPMRVWFRRPQRPRHGQHLGACSHTRFVRLQRDARNETLQRATSLRNLRVRRVNITFSIKHTLFLCSFIRCFCQTPDQCCVQLGNRRCLCKTYKVWHEISFLAARFFVFQSNCIISFENRLANIVFSVTHSLVFVSAHSAFVQDSYVSLLVLSLVLLWRVTWQSALFVQDKQGATRNTVSCRTLLCISIGLYH